MPALRRAAPTETHIREHAYYLWERDGRPHGRDVEFWARATAELTAMVERARPKAKPAVKAEAVAPVQVVKPPAKAVAKKAAKA